MSSSAKPWPAFRLAAWSLRMRLALLFAALFCVSAVAVGAVAVIFKPDFLVHTGRQADLRPARHTAPHPARCCQYAGHSFLATVTHDASQNVGGVVAVVVLAILAVGVGWLIAGRVLRPLRTINSSARAISASSLNQRLGLSGPRDEFTELADTLDELFGRLEASFEAQRRFVANASHELRTPLAAGRTVLQVALADPDADTGTLRTACEEALDLGQQQERLVAALLTLASSEGGIEHWQPFDLAEITAQVVADRRGDAGQAGLRVQAALAAAPATGDPSLAAVLVRNLVDNALRHNHPGGDVDISTSSASGRAVLTITNTGPAIPPGEVDRLFQPFGRLGNDRIQHAGGHGLGLTIAAAVASAHGATVTANARPEGGLHVGVSFPAGP
jgi:signal transduction histidine kinase